MADTKTFEYAVRDRSGKLVKGRIDANDQAAVARRLKSMGLAPVSVAEVQTTGLQREITIPGLGDRIGLKDLAVTSRQMATMVSAGLSLIRTLGILAEQTENKALAKVLGQVRSDVEVGLSLSASLEKHPQVFPPLMINMVRAGETGGFLERSLLSVAENFEAEVKLRGQIKSALAYPVGFRVFVRVDVLRHCAPSICMPHSSLSEPAQRPARSSSSGEVGRVQGMQPIER